MIVTNKQLTANADRRMVQLVGCFIFFHFYFGEAGRALWKIHTDASALALCGLVCYFTLRHGESRTLTWNLALAAYDANDSVRARERFGKLLEIDPSRSHCHYFLGLINVGEGSNDEARRHFERFLQLAPDDPEAGSVRDFLEHLQSP